LLQFDNDDIRVRIPDVLTDVYVPFHPGDTSRFDVNLLLSTVRECQTPLE
jgi:hypothetical protein